MKILSLDLGTRTGWAYALANQWADGCQITTGIQDFRMSRGESQGMIFIRFNAWLDEMITGLKPDLITYEMAHLRGGATADILVGMATRVLEKCTIAKIESTKIHSGTIKLWATGTGIASKAGMTIAAEMAWDSLGRGGAEGKHFRDDNEADAFLQVLYARWKFANVMTSGRPWVTPGVDIRIKRKPPKARGRTTIVFTRETAKDIKGFFPTGTMTGQGGGRE